MGVAKLGAAAPQNYGAIGGSAEKCPINCGAAAKNKLIYIKSCKSVFCGEKARFMYNAGAIHVNSPQYICMQTYFISKLKSLKIFNKNDITTVIWLFLTSFYRLLNWYWVGKLQCELINRSTVQVKYIFILHINQIRFVVTLIFNFMKKNLMTT